jgi:hypothetical protein
MPLSPAEVLSRTQEHCATCDSYVDEGEQISQIVGPQFPGGQETLSYRFRTAFVRPSDLFFDYREFWRGTEEVRAHGVICATAQHVDQWWSILPDRDTRTTLMTAISRFTGVSGGTVSAVPALLLATMKGGSALPDAGSARIVEEVEHEGRACLVIEGTRGASRWPLSVWIDPSTFLLCRSHRRMEFEERAYDVSVAQLREYLAVKRTDKSRAALKARLDSLAGRSSPGFAAETTTVWRGQMGVRLEPATFRFARPEV